MEEKNNTFDYKSRKDETPEETKKRMSEMGKLGGRPKKGSVQITRYKRLTKNLIKKAWEIGNLSYKLLPHQRELYTRIKESGQLKYVVNSSRRFGKSTVLCILAIEEALTQPDMQIKFAAPTAKMVRKITLPIMKRLCADAPEELRPEFKTQDSIYWFPNGSEIHIAGTDGGNAENLRGTSSDLNIIDEAGFVQDLGYVINDILMPQTLTTNGRTLIASTPPRTPDHDYVQIANDAIADDAYSHFTIYDNSSISDEVIERFIKESGGENSTTWKREYLAEFVTDEETQIVPHWKTEYEQEFETDLYRQFYHNYSALDIGGSIDKTALLFGFYDFKRATLFIEDELIFEPNRATSKEIAEGTKEKETSCFGSYSVYRRIADNNNQILLKDLGSMHDLYFQATTKEKLLEMVNEVRLWVEAGRIIINPRCKELIACLNGGVWARDRSGKVKHEFARSKRLGHYDCLAALVYLVRNIDQYTNPIPPNYQLDMVNTFIHLQTNHETKKYKDMFNSMGIKPNKDK